MTITQLIDQLADLGQVIGLNAEVKAWNLSEAQKLFEPLGIRTVADVSAGWDKATQAPVATIKLV